MEIIAISAQSTEGKRKTEGRRKRSKVCVGLHALYLYWNKNEQRNNGMKCNITKSIVQKWSDSSVHDVTEQTYRVVNFFLFSLLLFPLNPRSSAFEVSQCIS